MRGLEYRGSERRGQPGAHANRLPLVRYESLVDNPQAVLDGIYAFIDEPPFKHDTDNVQFDTREFDQRAGTPGLHDVRPSVHAVNRSTILPRMSSRALAMTLSGNTRNTTRTGSRFFEPLGQNKN